MGLKSFPHSLPSPGSLQQLTKLAKSGDFIICLSPSLAYLSNILWSSSGLSQLWPSMHICPALLSHQSFPRLFHLPTIKPLFVLFSLIALMLQVAPESSPANPSHSHSIPLRTLTFRESLEEMGVWSANLGNLFGSQVSCLIAFCNGVIF